MICILKQAPGMTGDLAQNVCGWIIAHDCHDARRQADMAGEMDLAQTLYRMEFQPPRGKHALPGGFLMLVT